MFYWNLKENGKNKRINLNIGLITLIYGDIEIQSRHFVQKFLEILV